MQTKVRAWCPHLVHALSDPQGMSVCCVRAQSHLGLQLPRPRRPSVNSAGHVSLHHLKMEIQMNQAPMMSMSMKIRVALHSSNKWRHGWGQDPLCCAKLVPHQHLNSPSLLAQPEVKVLGNHKLYLNQHIVFRKAPLSCLCLVQSRLVLLQLQYYPQQLMFVWTLQPQVQQCLHTLQVHPHSWLLKVAPYTTSHDRRRAVVATGQRGWRLQRETKILRATCITTTTRKVLPQGSTTHKTTHGLIKHKVGVQPHLAWHLNMNMEVALFHTRARTA